MAGVSIEQSVSDKDERNLSANHTGVEVWARNTPLPDTSEILEWLGIVLEPGLFSLKVSRWEADSTQLCLLLMMRL